MQIIKDNAIIKDHWHHIADDPIPEEGCITISLSRWRAERKQLIEREGGELGIRLKSEEAVEAISDDLEHFQMVALEFTLFADGRSFTAARLLRDRYHFDGEIRAMGAFLCEQVFHLGRVGVTAFEISNSDDLEDALAALSEISVKYQASSDQPKPLYQQTQLA